MRTAAIGGVWRPVPATPWLGGHPGWAPARPRAARRTWGARSILAIASVLSAGVLWWSAPWWRSAGTTVAPRAPAGPAALIPSRAPDRTLPGGPGAAVFAAVSASALRAALAAAEPPAFGPPPRWWSPALAAAAARTGLPVALLGAVAQAESQGDPAAVSPAGALGLMQLMPGTAAALGVRNVFNAAENALGGAEYLVWQLTAYDGGQPGCIPDPAACPQALALALAAYNAGPAAVARYHGIPPYAQTQFYVREVTALYLRYRLEG